jgi:hypothetical protein
MRKLPTSTGTSRYNVLIDTPQDLNLAVDIYPGNFIGKFYMCRTAGGVLAPA